MVLRPRLPARVMLLRPRLPARVMLLRPHQGAASDVRGLRISLPARPPWSGVSPLFTAHSGPPASPNYGKGKSLLAERLHTPSPSGRKAAVTQTCTHLQVIGAEIQTTEPQAYWSKRPGCCRSAHRNYNRNLLFATCYQMGQ
jgi:hypothetical protein